MLGVPSTSRPRVNNPFIATTRNTSLQPPSRPCLRGALKRTARRMHSTAAQQVVLMTTCGMQEATRRWLEICMVVVVVVWMRRREILLAAQVSGAVCVFLPSPELCCCVAQFAAFTPLEHVTLLAEAPLVSPSAVGQQCLHGNLLTPMHTSTHSVPRTHTCPCLGPCRCLAQVLLSTMVMMQLVWRWM